MKAATGQAGTTGVTPVPQANAGVPPGKPMNQDHEPFLQRRWVRLALYLGFWTLLGAINLAQTYLNYYIVNHYVLSPSIPRKPFAWDTRVGIAFVDWYTWAALTPFIWHVSRGFPFGRRTWPVSIAVHAFACLLVGFVVASAVALAEKLIDPYYQNWPFLDILRVLVLGSYFLHYIWIYWAIVGVNQAWSYYRQYRQREVEAAHLEAELAQSQLQALKAQLHPHFLFNTLNAISAMMHKDVELADRLVARLGELLRMTLDNAGRQEVPFRQELEFMQPYLEIMQARFGPRLQVDMKCQPEVMDACVPNLVWQPIVENAIRHGIAPRPEGGRLEMRARRVGDLLQLDVRDDGPGLPKDPDDVFQEGMGLAITRARLRHLYGANHRFEIRNHPEGGVHVTLTLPFRECTEVERSSGDEKQDVDRRRE